MALRYPLTAHSLPLYIFVVTFLVIHNYVDRGETLYSATWEKIPQGAAARQTFIDQTAAEFNAIRANLESDYHPVILNGYTDVAGETHLASIWERSPSDIGFWHSTPGLTRAPWNLYTAIWGIDHSDGYKNSAYPPYFFGSRTLRSFNESLAGANTAGSKHGALSVHIVNGVPYFTTLSKYWAAERPAYPAQTIYRILDCEAIAGSLEKGSGAQGSLVSLVGYSDGESEEHFAAILDDVAPAA
ncbi:hypothetical protein BDV12DRAFT_196051 [Aspergillus spectabilis]